MHRRPSLFVAFGALAVAVASLLALSLAMGSVRLDLPQVLAAFGSDTPSLARDVVLDLRLPRALAAFAVGGLLALSGALLQVLLRNPLADPYVLGVSGGASVAALVAIMLGLPAIGVDGFAAAGALAACLLVFALAQGPGGWTPTRLLLTGIVVAAGAGSVVSLLLALGDESQLRGMVFWLLGDLSRHPALAVAARPARGRYRRRHRARPAPQRAGPRRHAGRDRRPGRARLQLLLFVGSSVLTGCAVSAAGASASSGSSRRTSRASRSAATIAWCCRPRRCSAARC